MKLKYLILLAMSGFLVCADQIVKIYIHTQYRLGESTEVIPGFFNITYVRNFGAAFGFLSKSHPEFRDAFFLTMPPLALIMIVFILRAVADNDRVQILALSSIFGGAVGNYIDRLRFGYVVDFLDFHYLETYHWPAFNIADSAIVCGVGTLILQMLLQKNTEPSKAKSG